MDSRRRQTRVRPAAAVLVLSLLLHAALLLLPLPGPRPQSAPPGSPSVVVELIAPPRAAEPDPPPDPPPERPEPAEPTPENAASAQDVASAETSDTGNADPDDPPAETASAAEEIARESTPSTTGIRTQLLRAARELGRQEEATEDATGLRYREAPPLPSRPGWLDQYTGRVAASIERWQGSDGAHSARIVTGSGQVVCVRTRAPTTAEIFNPWMSSAVPMVRDCGRERPEAPDAADPWLRRPRADGK
ncbi:MAG: hypothetical protein GVY32_08025 [Gammaproteobacteria bacterium]|jgi:hypothetical protein|nr:hypothetical protein [Gammaproteobacteria bacterium]